MFEAWFADVMIHLSGWDFAECNTIDVFYIMETNSKCFIFPLYIMPSLEIIILYYKNNYLLTIINSFILLKVDKINI